MKIGTERSSPDYNRRVRTGGNLNLKIRFPDVRRSCAIFFSTKTAGHPEEKCPGARALTARHYRRPSNSWERENALPGWICIDL